MVLAFVWSVSSALTDLGAGSPSLSIFPRPGARFKITIGDAFQLSSLWWLEKTSVIAFRRYEDKSYDYAQAVSSLHLISARARGC